MTVTAVNSAINAINVPITKTITLTFNQKIQAGANYSAITLKKGTVGVSADHHHHGHHPHDQAQRHALVQHRLHPHHPE
jgi:hypothetical protein